jgi:hypothetical protein
MTGSRGGGLLQDEGPAEAQLIQADTDVVQLDLKAVQNDIASGASRAQLRQDLKALDAALIRLAQDEARFQADTLADLGINIGRKHRDGGTIPSPTVERNGSPRRAWTSALLIPTRTGSKFRRVGAGSKGRAGRSQTSRPAPAVLRRARRRSG